MSVALIEPVEMTATLNVVVSINSTTVMQTYWTASFLKFLKQARISGISDYFNDITVKRTKSEFPVFVML